jgi:hypothetical protein
MRIALVRREQGKSMPFACQIRVAGNAGSKERGGEKDA